jgi:bifunctional DNA primase/polymerase-like protein/AAA domain-containing protein
VTVTVYVAAADAVMLDAALTYAEHGVPVFPVWWAVESRCACGKPDCASPAKHPIGAVVPHGVLDATTDVNTIREWWTRYPAANIGTPTTWCSVLDVDPRHGGDAALRELERQHGALPETPQILTGGGGRHIYFRPVAGLAPSAGRVGPGIDVRSGAGAYVLMPPSAHVSGGTYGDDIMYPLLFEAELAAMPAWLAALASKPTTEQSNGHRLASDEWAEKLSGAPEGKRRAVALEIAGHYLGLRIAAEEVESIVLGFAAHCTPPFPKQEARELVRDLVRRDRARTEGTGHKSIGRVAVIVSAATIAPETVQWLWPGRLARGALCNCVGLPDQGKTLVFSDIAARLTTGAPMPPEPRGHVQSESQRVLILTLEDSWSTTLVPRLLKAGANLGLVDFVRMVCDPNGQTSLLTLADDLDALAGALAAQEYALVVVDGITGYLGNAKTHNDAEVRRVLAPFTALLDSANVAGLSVMHPPKAVTNLAYYAGGSVAFTAIPRVTLGVAPDPNDDNASPRRLLMKIKGNLYGNVPTLAYRIAADDPAAVPSIEWEPEPVTVNIADVLDPMKETAEDRSTRRSCEEWVRSYLSDGPRHSRDVEKAAVAAGFSVATLRRARERVVDSVKTGAPGREQQWEWRLR